LHNRNIPVLSWRGPGNEAKVSYVINCTAHVRLSRALPRPLSYYMPSKLAPETFPESARRRGRALLLLEALLVDLPEVGIKIGIGFPSVAWRNRTSSCRDLASLERCCSGCVFVYGWVYNIF